MVDSDVVSKPKDFGILTANFIGHHVEQGDAEIASVSEIALFHLNHKWEPTPIEHDFLTWLVTTEFGTKHPGYKMYMDALFEDLYRYGTFDMRGTISSATG